MTDKTQKQEMQDAYRKSRIPICVFCGHKLECVTIDQDEKIFWYWNEKEETYIKDSSGSSDAPIHECNECQCEKSSWDFLDENSEVRIGVAF